MASLLEWMNKPYPGNWPGHADDRPVCLPDDPTHLQVFVALNAINDAGFGGYGIISHGGGVYGRGGLNQAEYFELLNINAFVSGWSEGTEYAERDEICAALDAEVARVGATSSPPPDDERRFGSIYDGDD